MSHFEYIYGFHAVDALLQAQPELIIEVIAVVDRVDERMQALLNKAQQKNRSIILLSRSDFKHHFGHKVSHQGVVAKCHSFSALDETVLHTIVEKASGPKLILVLDGVQDPHNLGAILRSANALGVQAVVATKDRACSLTPAVRKVASGGAEATPFIQVTNLARTLQWLQQQGLWVVGLSGDAQSYLQEIDLTMNLVLVVGNEAKGMRQLTRKHCDFVAKIPMCGSVESFNVSVATGISLYEVMRQRQIAC